jgi:hypothetical protein
MRTSNGNHESGVTKTAAVQMTVEQCVAVQPAVVQLTGVQLAVVQLAEFQTVAQLVAVQQAGVLN